MKKSLMLLLCAAIPVAAQEPAQYSALRWRMIGPHRGGRTVGATGVRGKPNLFYVGVNNGGVWRTTDAGRTWQPIFDDQPTGSVGSLAVAPSNPDIIYVGSGEGLQRPDLSTGDGVYKSADGGKTWTNTGLRDGQQIPAVIIDPKDPNRVFVAVLGHPYGPNPERGVFRTVDGGKSWEKVLYKDENTGAFALAFDPTDSRIVFATLYEGRHGPWENGSWQGKNCGLYKSTDGGTTWKPLSKGLPTAEQRLGRIGFDIALTSPKLMFAVVDAPQQGGLYRSDDAGESWQRVNADARLWGRGSDFAEVKIDPKNPDVLYVANVCSYKSTDGGKTFAAFKGAPGGDDPHTFWINPDDTDIILLAGDQGACVSVNGGKTWSSWYNQPTAQFYHVICDNQFPYWVYGGQQESGSAAVCSRGWLGQITFRDWHPVGVEEYGYVAPDPLNPNIIYGGKITRFDRITGQVQDISPEVVRSGKFRFLRTAPVLFAPTDPKCLYFAGNVLFKTTNGGNSWDVISPDLSRKQPDVPESIGIYRTEQMKTMPRRGVIYTVAPSYKDSQTIWAGTDDGLIHVTRDGGKTWNDVTPSGLTAWSKVSLMDAGRHDANTAYAAISRIRLDDMKPHIYRTHDGGKTWTEIVRGLPDNAPVNCVREDPRRKGLLFCGTERAVHVSFNDGDDWHPLRLNMPATSIRDLVVHGDDVVVGTHGRSFWILDDITPLRELEAKIADVHLFKPQLATRVRWNMNTDTPLPPEEPAGQNPPDGAIINFYLRQPGKLVTLEILGPDGRLIRRYASDDKPEPVDGNRLEIPTSWIRPPQILPRTAGAHRFVWDLRYPPPPGPRRYPMTAIIHDTPSEPLGPWVMPGQYKVRLTADGLTQEQPLTVRMDPRVKTPDADLKRQFELSMRCYRGVNSLRAAQADLRKLRASLRDLKTEQKALRDEIAELDRKAAAMEGAERRRGQRAADSPREPTIGRVVGELEHLIGLLQGADVAPTTQVVAACDAVKKTVDDLLAAAAALREKSKALEEKLRK